MEELMLVVVRLLKVATPCIFLDFFLPTAGAGGAVAAGRGFLLLLLLLLLLISGVVCGKQRRQIISKFDQPLPCAWILSDLLFVVPLEGKAQREGIVLPK